AGRLFGRPDQTNHARKRTTRIRRDADTLDVQRRQVWIPNLGLLRYGREANRSYLAYDRVAWQDCPLQAWHDPARRRNDIFDHVLQLVPDAQGRGNKGRNVID